MMEENRVEVFERRKAANVVRKTTNPSQLHMGKLLACSHPDSRPQSQEPRVRQHRRC